MSKTKGLLEEDAPKQLPQRLEDDRWYYMYETDDGTTIFLETPPGKGSPYEIHAKYCGAVRTNDACEIIPYTRWTRDADGKEFQSAGGNEFRLSWNHRFRCRV